MSDKLDISENTDSPRFGVNLGYDSTETDREFRTSISRDRGELS